MTIEYTDYVRKPFIVKAVEITEENIAEIAAELGQLKHKEEDDTPYIAVRKGAVPNVSKVFVGWFMTRHGKRTHCYAPKIFEQQFIESDSEMTAAVEILTGTEKPATV